MRKICQKPKIEDEKYTKAKKIAIASLCESQIYCYIFKNMEGNYEIAWEYFLIPESAIDVEFIHKLG